jgi:uncharacterized membrane protein
MEKNVKECLDLKVLVLIHVLSSILGVGPTFFAHVLLRKGQSLEELRTSLKLGKILEFFPKVGGTVAVLSGILLLIIGSYGGFDQLWIIASLIAYICIQFIVVGLAAPVQKKLAAWVFDPINLKADNLPQLQKSALTKVSNLFYIASTLGVLLFIFMILKP